MIRLQRRTSFLTTALIAVALLSGGFGFGLYLASGMATSIQASSAQPTLGQDQISYGLVWGQVFLASVVAAAVLIAFSAKGTRLVCTAIVGLAAISGMFAAVVTASWSGA